MATSEGHIPRLFLVFAFLLGVPFAFLNPPLQAPDEFAHFYRAYGVSQGEFVAHDTTRVPVSVVALCREFPIHLETAHRIHERDLINEARRPLREADSIGVANEGMGMYSFVPYLASGAIIRLGRLFSVSPLGLLYLGRLANGIAYAVLVYFALGLLPDFRVLLFCLALVPTALHQAYSLSIDAVTFSIAFLFCAYLLHLAFDPAIARIGPRQHAAVAGLTTLAALCKADVILLLLTVLISSKKFSSRRARGWSLVCYGTLATSVSVGWSLINKHNLKLWEMARLRWGISLTGNWQFVVQHPVLFVATAVRTARLNAFDYLDNFVSTIGWLAASIPEWIVFTYLALLLTVASTQTQRVVLGAWQKAIAVVVFLSGAAAIFIMLWGFETPTVYIQQYILPGYGEVPGVQGRYFIPFALPLCLLLSNNRLRLSAGWILGSALLTACLASGAAWIAMRQTYYAPDGVTQPSYVSANPSIQKLEGRLVRKPGSSREERKVYFIEGGRKRWVTTADWIISKGMKWPSDVMLIDGRELDAIPLGPTLP